MAHNNQNVVTPATVPPPAAPISYADMVTQQEKEQAQQLEEQKLQKQAYEDALDEVHTRFILNLPPEELTSSDRIMFQLEQAWWFYEDMICDRAPPELKMPRFSNLKPFCKILFDMSPLLNSLGKDFSTMWSEFSAYKRKISTYGTILLNDSVKGSIQIVLCQLWNGTTWTLPAGKINQGESGDDAAARETYEETGFDPNCRFGMTKQWKEEEDEAVQAGGAQANANTNTKITWSYPLKDEDALTFVDQNGKRRTCYVCKGVPLDFPFEPVARKEVSEIKWYDLDGLPKKSFAVLPFVGKLKKWINKKKKVDKKKEQQRAKSRDKSRDKSSGRDKSRDKSSGRDKSTGRRDKNNADKRSNSKKRGEKSGGGRSASNTPRRAIIQDMNDPLVDAGLAELGDTNRWSEEDMFKANEQLLGRKIDYDGNPHVFAEHGFSGNDPHAFRVVGGTFMNSASKNRAAVAAAAAAATAQPPKQYQPLVSRDDTVTQLTPFFTQAGETPWGDVVEEAKVSGPSREGSTSGVDAGEALLAMLQGGPMAGNKSDGGAEGPTTVKQAQVKSDQAQDPIDVMTDAQITARSQQRYREQQKTRNDQYKKKYLQDMEFIEQWVNNLPKPVDFKLKNVDSILRRHF